jgi:hypothetical protein
MSPTNHRARAQTTVLSLMGYYPLLYGWEGATTRMALIRCTQGVAMPERTRRVQTRSEKIMEMTKMVGWLVRGLARTGATQNMIPTRQPSASITRICLFPPTSWLVAVLPCGFLDIYDTVWICCSTAAALALSRKRKTKVMSAPLISFPDAWLTSSSLLFIVVIFIGVIY